MPKRTTTLGRIAANWLSWSAKMLPFGTAFHRTSLFLTSNYGRCVIMGVQVTCHSNRRIWNRLEISPMFGHVRMVGVLPSLTRWAAQGRQRCQRATADGRVYGPPQQGTKTVIDQS